MKSIDDRLADANPVTEAYVPATYDQMLTRAMRQTRTHDPVWRTFRLRMAGSVTAASAVTVLAVSALNGAGAALPVLGFSATAAHAAGSTAAGATQSTASPTYSATTVYGPPSMAMRIRPVNYVFHGGDAFSSAAGSATAYSVTAPTDLAATLNAAASALGITLGTTPSPQNSATYYGVSGGGYTATVYGGSVMPLVTWDIYATASGPSGVSGVTSTVGTAVSPPAVAGTSGVTGASGASSSPSGTSGATGNTAPTNTAALLAQAEGYVTSLGYHPGTATVEATVSTAATGGYLVIRVPLLIDGLPSNLRDVFNIGDNGVLQGATGTAFQLSAVATYPLLSPADAVSQITAQLSSAPTFWGGVATSSPSVGSSVPVPTTSGPQALPMTQMIPLAAASASGATGVTGASGANGVSGATGPVIAPSIASVTGVNGTSGTSGASGASGATGPTGATGATTTTVTPTPLTSGVTPLQLKSNATVGASGASGTTGPVTATGTSGASGATGVTGPTTTTTLPTTVVNLTSVTPAYSLYQMKGGVWMELPVYNYVGTPEGQSYTMNFTVVPLPARYLNFAAPAPLPLGAR